MTYNLPLASDEQLNVIKSIKEYNVIVDAVAGSGKTTCVLNLALKYKKSNILLLTYNAKLKIETRQKIKSLNILNVEVHSYHSFCVKYYDKMCFTDKAINDMLKKDIQKTTNYDIIILDEVQDVKQMYYELVCKIYSLNSKSCRICILGDFNQCIFAFNGADERYITNADTLFNFNQNNWTKCKLSQSFRVTDQIADFINNCMLNNNRIISKKISKHKPRYLICNTYSDGPFNEVKMYLQQGFKSDDIFILAPSIRNKKSPIRVLENLIKIKLKVLVYVPTSDDEVLDQEVMENKLVFSTFHQVKGLERKVTIIFNFDSSYSKFFNKSYDKMICPNELYVATTRALERLTIIHDLNNNYLEFLNKNLLKYFCEIIQFSELNVKKEHLKKTELSVTDLVRHLPFDLINNLMKYLTIKDLTKEKKILNIPIKSKQIDGYENVSEITGLAIPAYYEFLLKGEMAILYHLINENKFPCGVDQIIEKISIEENDRTTITELNTSQLLYLSNKWNSKKTGLMFKVCQITDYDWLSDYNLKKSIKRLNKLGIANALFEKEVQMSFFNLDVVGFIDCVSENNVYEFKCVKELKEEHFLQLAIYMFMNESMLLSENKYDIVDIFENKMNYYLFNIMTNELFLIKCEYDKLKEMIKSIVNHKFSNHLQISNEEFIQKNLKIFNKYINAS